MSNSYKSGLPGVIVGITVIELSPLTTVVLYKAASKATFEALNEIGFEIIGD